MTYTHQLKAVNKVHHFADDTNLKKKKYLKKINSLYNCPLTLLHYFLRVNKISLYDVIKTEILIFRPTQEMIIKHLTVLFIK